MKDVNTVKVPTPVIEDNGTALPPLRIEPAKVTDDGKIRMGSFSPPFPAPRAK